VSGETQCSAQQCSSCSGASRFDINFKIYQYIWSVLFELHNERSIVILRTLNTRNYFPTFRHDGFCNVWALAEWFTCFQLGCNFYCLRPNHPRWSRNFWKLNESNLLVLQAGHYIFFPITCTRNWKEKRLCYKSVSTVNFHPQHACWTSSPKFYVLQISKFYWRNAQRNLDADCDKYCSKVNYLYGSCVDYLMKWMQWMIEISFFTWMTLNDIPQWSSVQRFVKLLINKGFSIDNVKCFDQFINLIKFLEICKGNEKFWHTSAHEKILKL
jgi:hypothetical protein